MTKREYDMQFNPSPGLCGQGDLRAALAGVVLLALLLNLGFGKWVAPGEVCSGGSMANSGRWPLPLSPLPPSRSMFWQIARSPGKVGSPAHYLCWTTGCIADGWVITYALAVLVTHWC